MKNTGLLIAAALVAAGVAVGLYGARSFLKPPPPAPGLSSAPAEAPAALPANLPPLDQSDDFVRRRAGALSSDAAFRQWLKQESLIARLTAAMSRIAHGGVPRDIFSAFAPKGKFRVVRKSGRTFADPASYARYDGFAATVAGVDAVAAAKLFTELVPLFDAALRGLGENNPSALSVLLAASRELTEAPVPADDADLTEGRKGIGWVYVDERLENLSLAQKQIMRMGPRNQAAVQAKLRALTLALGN